MSLVIKAPAKVNLCLEVKGKRRDGFHELDTIFEAIDIYDELYFELKPSGIELNCKGRKLPNDRSNLVYRAADLILKKYRVSKGVVINLDKRIPIAAGLGGGSSDAAATIIGLNKLFKLKLSQKKMIQLAASLGSDIPFFIMKANFARGKGRGELLRKILSEKKLWHVLVTPNTPVLAKDVYNVFNINALTRHVADARMLQLALRKDSSLGELKKSFRNDLEAPVLSLKPSLKRLKKDLTLLSKTNAMVSGSGPTVFCVVSSKKKATEVKEAISKRYPRATVSVASTYKF